MREHIGTVLGKTPSGLFVLTAKSPEGNETGMLASWVQQASFEPPMVTVAVNRKRYINEWITETEHLALSIVGKSQKALLGRFGKGFEPNEDAFAGLSMEHTPEGLPVVVESLGWMSGHIVGALEAGDHMVYAVELTSAGRGILLDDDKPWVHVRKSGFGY